MQVAELFLGALLPVLLEKLGSGLILAFARRERIEKLLKRWTKTLPIIQAYINDAEEKQLTETAVKKWLEDLRDLAYDLDDVLDEIYTEAQVQKSKGVEGRSGKLWRSCIPTCQNFSPRNFLFKEKMKSKIEEIADRLEENERIGNNLNLSKHLAGSTSQLTGRLPSTSVEEPHVYGRDEDKEAICKLMMENRENVSFIPIVGMGGIGKTTLVQLIYNDVKITGAFDMKSWVCISEEFDVFDATKIIFDSVSKEKLPESKDLNMLQERLHATFSNKKFLLILDDVWNKDYGKWDAFVRPFRVGLPGSKVLITTRDNDIAAMVRPGLSYQVKVLSDGDCQSLLAQHALGRNNFDEHPNLKRIGEALARKCKGLPLAAKTLGGVLRSKERDEDWEGVLHSKIWDLPEGNNNILPVLRLSYHHLPPHLKHLFAYCSIFPKDYEFDKFELVLLWMAEGFLTQSAERKTKEEWGFECFDELLSRSLFQRLDKGTKEQRNNSSRFVMHDLVNDLAQFVAGDICYKMDEIVETDDEYRIPVKARHASFLRHEYEVFKKFNGFYRVKGLRTFLPMPLQNPNTWQDFYLSRRILFKLLPNLHKSRVLSLSGYRSITEVPDSICKLIHLRYLNLSRTRIFSLPDSVKDLYNLETLSIRECQLIDKLPPTMGNLVNLRHLDNSNTDRLKELPAELGGLKSLQSLPRIVLSKGGGLALRDLGNLKLLRGVVVLLELQNVSDINDAKEASIITKEIEELQLKWGSDRDGSIDGQFEENVLDALQPHKKLEKLEIYFYGGVRFPSWIGDPLFSKVFSVSLTGCSQCTCLPPLGLLPELKHLQIRDMPKIKSVGDEFLGKHVVGVRFPKLEILELDGMPEWESWSGFPDENGMQFPSLYELTISGCPKLASVSPLSLPVLRSLKLKYCSMVVLERLCNLGSLKYLHVESVAGLPHLPIEFVQSMTNVEHLKFEKCSELVSVWPNGEMIRNLRKLRGISVEKCALFVSLVDEQQQLPPNLEILEFTKCGSLTLVPNIPENAIKDLTIRDCNGVESLPSDISTLERLRIAGCQSLKNWSAGNFPSGLGDLGIHNCKQLEAVPAEMFPPNIRVNLESLYIFDWQKLSSLLPHVHNFSRLTRLHLSCCDGVEYFPDQGIPPNLKILYVRGCYNLRSLPTQIQNTPSIQSITIEECRKLESFPGFEFPRNLSQLHVRNCGELKPLSQWGLHRLTSLTLFSIWGGFEELQLLTDINHTHLFPPSLLELYIGGFSKLRSVSETRVLDNLTSLRRLVFSNCKSLDDLPTQTILDKLWKLDITYCPLLKQRCQKDKSDYWPKIAGIPQVRIDHVDV